MRNNRNAGKYLIRRAVSIMLVLMMLMTTFASDLGYLPLFDVKTAKAAGEVPKGTYDAILVNGEKVLDCDNDKKEYTVAYGDKVELSLDPKKAYPIEDAKGNVEGDAKNIQFRYLVKKAGVDPMNPFTHWVDWYTTAAKAEDGNEDAVDEKHEIILEPGTDLYLSFDVHDNIYGKDSPDGVYVLHIAKSQIAAPSGISWKSTDNSNVDFGTFVWRPSQTNVTGGRLDSGALVNYELKLYKEGIADPVITDSYSTTNQYADGLNYNYNFAGNFTTNGYGDYYCTVQALVSDAKANYYESSEIVRSETVSYYDHSFPKIVTYTIDPDDEKKLAATATDTGSGIYAYCFTTSAIAPGDDENWTKVPEGMIKEKNNLSYSCNYAPTASGTYYFHVKDGHGNITTSEQSYKVTRIVYHNYDPANTDAKDKTVLRIGNEESQVPELTSLASPSRKGYTFVSWHSEADPQTDDNMVERIKVSQLGSSDIELYPMWIASNIGVSITADKDVNEEGAVVKDYDGKEVTLIASVDTTDYDGISYEWYKGDVKIEDATSQYLKVKDASDTGAYKVRVALEHIGDDTTYGENAEAFSVTINKVDVTVTAEDKTVSYGDEAPAFTYTYDGLVNGETSAVITPGVPSCEYVKGSNVGEYDITISKTSGFRATNYNFDAFHSAKLTVNPKDVTKEDSGVTVALSTTSYTYVPDVQPVPGVTVMDSVLSSALVENTDYTATPSNNVTAGTAKMTVEFKGNYTGTIEKTYEIKKADYTPELSVSGWKYGEYSLIDNGPAVNEVHGALTYEYCTKTGEDTYSEWSNTKPTNVGQYKVRAVIKASDNYNAQQTAEKIFEITPRYVVLRTESVNFPFDGNAHSAPTVTIVKKGEEYKGKTVDGLSAADEFKYYYCNTSITNVGSTKNAIKWELPADIKNNYIVDLDEGTLTVGSATLANPSSPMWSDVKSGVAKWAGVSRPGLKVKYVVRLLCDRTVAGVTTKSVVKNDGTQVAIGAAGADDILFETYDTEYNFYDIIKKNSASAEDGYGLGTYYFEVHSVPEGGNYAEESGFVQSDKINTSRVTVLGTNATEIRKVAIWDGDEVERVKDNPDDKLRATDIVFAGETFGILADMEDGHVFKKPWTYSVKPGSVVDWDSIFTVVNKDYESTRVTMAANAPSNEYIFTASGSNPYPTGALTFKEYPLDEVHPENDYHSVTLNAFCQDSGQLDSYCVKKFADVEDMKANSKSVADDEWIKIVDKTNWIGWNGKENRHTRETADVSVTITEPGMYFLGVKDNSGQITWVETPLTVHKVTLTAGEGVDMVAHPDVTLLKVAGQAITLPWADTANEGGINFQKPGYGFLQWKSSLTSKLYNDHAEYATDTFAAAATLNKEDVLVAQWSNDLYPYKVNYYFMDATGNYKQKVVEDKTVYVPDETVDMVGVHNKVLHANDGALIKRLTGMEIDTEKTSSFTLDKKDKVFDIFYKRKQYEIQYSYTRLDGTVEILDSKTQTYYYGEDLTQEGTRYKEIAKPTAGGENESGYEFVGWTYENTGDRPTVMPNGDVKATGRFEPKQAYYKINYYVKDLTGDTYTLKETETKYAKHNESIHFAIDNEYAKDIEGCSAQYVGYNHGSNGNGVRGEVVTTSINPNVNAIQPTIGDEAYEGEDKTLQINYYYQRNTYKLYLNVWKGDHEVGNQLYQAYWEYLYGQEISAEVSESLENYYETTIVKGNTSACGEPASDRTSETIKNNLDLEGYALASYSDWSTGSRPTTMPAGNVSLTRDYVNSIIAPYQVEVYEEKEEEGKYKLDQTLTYYGTAGSTVRVATSNPENNPNVIDVNSWGDMISNPSHYTYDSSIEGTVSSGKITKEGDLVLKVYLRRSRTKAKIIYEFYINGEHQKDQDQVGVTDSHVWGSVVDFDPIDGEITDENPVNFNQTSKFEADGGKSYRDAGYVVSYHSSYTLPDGSHTPKYNFDSEASLTNHAYKTAATVKYSVGKEDTTVSTIYVKYSKFTLDPIYLNVRYHTKLSSLWINQAPTLDAYLSYNPKATEDKVLVNKNDDKDVPAGYTAHPVRMVNMAYFYKPTITTNSSAATYPGLNLMYATYDYQTQLEDGSSALVLRDERKAEGITYTDVTDDFRLAGDTYHYYLGSDGYIYIITNYSETPVTGSDSNPYAGNRLLKGYDYSISVNDCSKIDNVLDRTMVDYGNNKNENSPASVYNRGAWGIQKGNNTLTYSFVIKDRVYLKQKFEGNTYYKEITRGERLSVAYKTTNSNIKKRDGYDIAWYSDPAYTKPVTETEKVTGDVWVYGRYEPKTCVYNKNVYYELANSFTLGADEDKKEYRYITATLLDTWLKDSSLAEITGDGAYIIHANEGDITLQPSHTHKSDTIKGKYSDGSEVKKTYDVPVTVYTYNGVPVMVKQVYKTYSYTEVAFADYNDFATNYLGSDDENTTISDFKYAKEVSDNKLNAYVEIGDVSKKVVELSAYFAREQYTLVIDENNKKVNNTISYDYNVGNTITVKNPTRDGYEFESWKWQTFSTAADMASYKDLEDIPNPIDVDIPGEPGAKGIQFDMPGQNIKLTAVFKPIEKDYVINHYYASTDHAYRTDLMSKIDLLDDATGKEEQIVLDGEETTATVIYETADQTGDPVAVAVKDGDCTYYYEYDAIEDGKVECSLAGLFMVRQEVSLSTTDKKPFAEFVDTSNPTVASVFPFSNAVYTCDTDLATYTKAMQDAEKDKESKKTFTVDPDMSVEYYYTRKSDLVLNVTARVTDESEATPCNTTVNGAGTYAYGADIEAQAAIEAGCTFMGWYKAEDVLTGYEIGADLKTLPLSAEKLAKATPVDTTVVDGNAVYAFKIKQSQDLVAVVSPLPVKEGATIELKTDKTEYTYNYAQKTDNNKKVIDPAERLEATVILPKDAGSETYISGYKWYQKSETNEEWTEVPNAISDSILFPKGLDADTYYFKCVATVKRSDNGRSYDVETPEDGWLKIVVDKAELMATANYNSYLYSGELRDIRATLDKDCMTEAQAKALQEGVDYQIYYSCDVPLNQDNYKTAGTLYNSNEAFVAAATAKKDVQPSEEYKNKVMQKDVKVHIVGDRIITDYYKMYYYIVPVDGTKLEKNFRGAANAPYVDMKITPLTLKIEGTGKAFSRVYDGTTVVSGDVLTVDTDKYRLSQGDDTDNEDGTITPYYTITGWATGEEDSFILDFDANFNTPHVSSVSSVKLENMYVVNKGQTVLSRNYNYQFEEGKSLTIGGYLTQKELAMDWYIESGDTGTSDKKDDKTELTYNYNGEMHRPIAKLDETKLSEEEKLGLSLDYTAGQINEGDYTAVATLNVDNSKLPEGNALQLELGDFKLSQTECKYAITAPDITIVPIAKTEEYNGENHSITAFQIQTGTGKDAVTINLGEETDGTFTLNGKDYTYTVATVGMTGDAVSNINGLFTDAGVYTVKPKDILIKNSSGKNVTENFKVAYDTTTLTITKKPVGIQGITALDKVYDGTTDATLVFDYDAITYVGLLAKDTLSLDEDKIVGTFESASVGEHTVNIKYGEDAFGTGVLTGASAKNYCLNLGDSETACQKTTTAKITKGAITIKPENLNSIYGEATALQANVVDSDLFSPDTLNNVEIGGKITYIIHTADGTKEVGRYTYEVPEGTKLAGIETGLGVVPFDDMKLLAADDYVITLDVSELTSHDYSFKVAEDASSAATLAVAKRKVVAVVKTDAPLISKEYDKTTNVLTAQSNEIKEKFDTYVDFVQVEDNGEKDPTTGLAVYQSVKDIVAFVEFDAVYNHENVAGTDKGDTVIISNIKLSNDNYELVASTLDLKAEITPIPLTITAKNQTIHYGADDRDTSTWEAEYEGFVAGDNKDNALDTAVSFTDDYCALDEAAGKGNKNYPNISALITAEDELYKITPGGVNAVNGNYTITFVDGRLTVIPAEIKISMKEKDAEAGRTYSMVYGDKDMVMPTNAAWVNFTGWKYSDQTTLESKYNPETENTVLDQIASLLKYSFIEETYSDEANLLVNAGELFEPPIAGNYPMIPVVTNLTSSKEDYQAILEKYPVLKNYTFVGLTDQTMHVNHKKLQVLNIAVKPKYYDGSEYVILDDIVTSSDTIQPSRDIYFGLVDSDKDYVDKDELSLNKTKLQKNGLVFELAASKEKAYTMHADVVGDTFTARKNVGDTTVRLNYQLDTYMSKRYAITFVDNADHDPISQDRVASKILHRPIQFTAHSSKASVPYGTVFKNDASWKYSNTYGEMGFAPYPTPGENLRSAYVNGGVSGPILQRTEPKTRSTVVQCPEGSDKSLAWDGEEWDSGYSSTAGSFSQVGTYTVVPSGFVEKENNNYYVSYKSDTFEVTQTILDSPTVTFGSQKDLAPGKAQFNTVSKIGDVDVVGYKVSLYAKKKGEDTYTLVPIQSKTAGGQYVLDAKDAIDSDGNLIVAPDSGIVSGTTVTVDLLETIRANGAGAYAVAVQALADTVGTNTAGELVNENHKNVLDSLVETAKIGTAGAKGISNLTYAANVVLQLANDDVSTEALKLQNEEGRDNGAIGVKLSDARGNSLTNPYKADALVSRVYVSGETGVQVNVDFTKDLATGFKVEQITTTKNGPFTVGKATVDNVLTKSDAYARAYENTIAISKNMASTDITVPVKLHMLEPTIHTTLKFVHLEDAAYETNKITGESDFISDSYVKAPYKFSANQSPKVQLTIQAQSEDTIATSDYDYEVTWCYISSKDRKTIVEIPAKEGTVTSDDTTVTAIFRLPRPDEIPTDLKVATYTIYAKIKAVRRDNGKSKTYTTNGNDIGTYKYVQAQIYPGPVSVSVTQEGWKYGNARTEAVVTKVVDKDFKGKVGVYYHEDTGNVADLAVDKNAYSGATPTGWTTTVPTDAGHYYVRAGVYDDENYTPTISDYADFNITKNTLAAPTALEVPTPSSTVSFGTVNWKGVDGYVENAGTTPDSSVVPKYKVDVAYWADAAEYTAWQTDPENHAPARTNDKIVADSDKNGTVNIADFITAKGTYEVTVTAMPFDKAKDGTVSTDFSEKNVLRSASISKTFTVDGEVETDNKTYEKVYDAEPIVLKANFGDNTIENYQWFKNGVLVDSQMDGKNCNVTYVEESGEYYCVGTTSTGKIFTLKRQVTITPKPITITAGSGTRDYDGTAYTLATCSAGAGDLATYNAITDVIADFTMTADSTVTTVAEGEKANKIATLTIKRGDKVVYQKASGNGFDVKNNNYTVTYVDGKIQVIPIADTITIEVADKVYDAKEVTSSSSDVTVDRRGSGDLTYTFYTKVAGSYVAMTENPIDVGTYYVRVVEAAAGDYRETAAKDKNHPETEYAEFKITPAPLKIIAADKSSTYGDDPVELTYTYEAGKALYERDTDLTVVLTAYENYVTEGNSGNIVLSKTTPVNDGTAVEYPIVVTTTGAHKNYETPEVVNAKYTVKKKGLTVTANDKTIQYKQDAANAGVTYSGFVNGDTAETAGLTGTLAYVYKTNDKNSDYAAGSPVGTYKIIPSGIDSANYSIIFKDGTLTVEPAPLKEITLVDASKTFNNAVITPEIATLTAEVTGVTAWDIKDETIADSTKPYTIQYVYQDDTPSGTVVSAPKQAGTYKVIATAKAGTNYTGSVETRFTVEPFSIAGATVTAPDVVYNKTEQKPVLTIEVNGQAVALTEGTDYTATFTNNVNVSTEANPATVTITGIGNYAGTAATATFKVTPAPVTIKAADVSTSFGTKADVSASVTSGTVYDGDDLHIGAIAYEDETADPKKEVTAKTPVGTYVIHPTYTADANYKVTVVNGTYTVEDADLPHTAEGYAKVYDTNAHGIKVEVTADEKANAKIYYSEQAYTTKAEFDEHIAADDGTVTETNPTYTDVCNKTVYYYIVLDNYKPVVGSKTVEITPADQVLTFENAEFTYDGTAKDMIATASYENPTITYTGNGKTDVASYSEVDAGVYTVTANATATGNYKAASKTVTLTIQQRKITLTADSDEKVYNGTALTKNSYQITSGTLAANEEITAVTIVGSQTEVNTETEVNNNVITEGSVKIESSVVTPAKDVTSNYDITLLPGTLRVTPAADTLTIKIEDKVYDTTAVTKDDVTVENQLGTGTLTYTFYKKENDTYVALTEAPVNVGTYYVRVVETAAGNYAETVAKDEKHPETEYAEFKITPAPVTITAQPATSVYKKAVATVTATKTSGTIYAGDDLHIGAVAYESYTDADTNAVLSNTTPVGTYPIKPVYTPNSNYEVRVVDAVYTVTKASDLPYTKVGYDDDYDKMGHSIVVAISDTKETSAKIYYSSTVLTAEEFASKVADYKNGTGDGSISEEAPAYMNAGDYTTYFYIISDNYEPVLDSETVKIHKIVNPVVFENVTERYDGTAKSIAATVEESATITYAGNGKTDLSSYEEIDAGVYEVTATVAETTNYKPTTKTATLTIQKRQITVKADDATKAYDKTALIKDTVSVSEGSLADQEAITTAVVTGSQLHAGESDNVITENSIVITKTVGAEHKDVTANYTITLQKGTLTVTPAAVTIQAADAMSAYKQELAEVHASVVSGTVYDGDDLAITAKAYKDVDANKELTKTAPAGQYVIRPGYTANADYTVTVVDGTYTITKDTLPYTVEGYVGVYDGAGHSITAKVTDENETNVKMYYSTTEYTAEQFAAKIAANDESVSETNPAFKNVGTYTVYCYIDTPNYTAVVVHADVVISKKVLTVTANDKTICYQNPAANAGVSYAGFVTGDNETNSTTGTVTYTYTKEGTAYEVGSPAGKYDITPAGLMSDNYEIAYGKGTMTVLPEHTYGEWVTTKEPTQTEDGEAKRTCSVCGHEQKKGLPSKDKEGNTGGVTGSVEGDPKSTFTVHVDQGATEFGRQENLENAEDFEIMHLPNGEFNIVVEEHFPDGTFITETWLLTIKDGEVVYVGPLKVGTKQTLADVAPKAPQVAVNELEGVYKNLPDQVIDEGVTPDKIDDVIANGGDVKVILNIDEPQSEKAVTAINTKADQDDKVIGTVFDASMNMHILPDGAPEQIIPIDKTNNLILLAVPLSKDELDKEGYVVYYTDINTGAVEKLPQLTGGNAINPTDKGFYIEDGYAYLWVDEFSTFAIGTNKPASVTPPDNNGEGDKPSGGKPGGSSNENQNSSYDQPGAIIPIKVAELNEYNPGLGTELTVIAVTDKYDKPVEIKDTNLKYQWQETKDGTTWTDIKGATHSTYVVQSTDVGKKIRCVVTGINHYCDTATTIATVKVSNEADIPTIVMNKELGYHKKFQIMKLNTKGATVSYYSADKKYVTINKKGIIYGKKVTKPGKPVKVVFAITKGEHQVQYVTNVRVTKKVKKNYSLVKYKTKYKYPSIALYKLLYLKSKYTIKLTHMSGSTVHYKTSNKKVATVDERGVVRGKKKGTADITVVVNRKGITYEYFIRCRVCKRGKEKNDTKYLKVVK